MRRRVGIVLLLLLAFVGRAAHAGLYDEFVTLDADTKYFRNADGLFCGFGMNYNQIIDGKMFIYFGCGDKHVGVANCMLDDLVDHLLSCPA